MDKKENKFLSDFDMVQEVEKFHLPSLNKSDKIILNKRPNYEPSQINKVSHILFSSKFLNEENFVRNFSDDQLSQIYKGTKELMEMMEKISKKPDSTSKKNPKTNSIISEIINKNQIFTENNSITKKNDKNNVIEDIKIKKEEIKEINHENKKIEKTNTSLKIKQSIDIITSTLKPSSPPLNINFSFNDPINISIDMKEKEPKSVSEKQDKPEKLLKNKTLDTTKKYKLKILQQSSCINANCLNQVFSQENDVITFHFYALEIVAKDKYVNGKLFSSKKGLSNNKSFGIITQEDFGIIPNFKLLNPQVINEKAFNIEIIQIKYQKRRKIKSKSFKSFVTFHQKLFDDLYSRKDSSVIDISRVLIGDVEERRYLIAPIMKTENGWDFDSEILNMAGNFFMNNYSKCKSVSDLLSETKDELKQSSDKQIKLNLHDKLKKHIIFTDYKFNIYYYKHIFFMEDDSQEFFQRSKNCLKLAAEVSLERFEENGIQRRGKEELINVLKVKYFKTSDVPIIEKNKIEYLVLNSETNSESFLHYRKLKDKFNLNINYKRCPFVMVIPSKSIINENYTYNCHYNLKNANHSFKQIKKKYKSDCSIYPILPISNAKIYFLNKQQWKFACKLPSVLVQFERFNLIHQMINTMKLLSKPPTENELMHFTAAVTAPAMIEDYNYEVLETLGDSVLKFLVTFYLFSKYPDFKEGHISRKRNELTKNNYLYEKGKNSCLVNYIYSSPYNMKNWDPPLKFKHIQRFEYSITKKVMADVLEAVMGASFLSNEMFNTCIAYFKYIDFINEKVNFSSDFLSKFVELKSSDFLNLEVKDVVFESDISFYELFTILKLYICDNDQDIIEDNKEKKILGLKFKSQDYKKTEKIDQILVYLEEKCLNYKFKNKSLLRLALTHKSVDMENSYERLEILGDAIVELYIMATMFHLYGNKINFDENFNPGNLSKVKAFLSSNYFLLRISTFFRLHEYLMISPSNSKKVEEAERYINRLDFSQKLNEYEDSNLGRPKIISDIFESLIGAVLVDSNIAECFKILNIMLGPFVAYCVKYIGKLKYSPISELVEKVQERFKTSPNFTAIKLDEREISVQVIIDNSVFAKGVGHTEEAGKEAACIKALKKLKNKDK